MKLEWIIREDTRILYVDFRGAPDDDSYLSLLHQVLQRTRESPGSSFVLYNLQDVIFPHGVLEAIANFAKAKDIHPGKAAFVGMSKINEKLLQKLDKFLSNKTERKLFQSEDEAIACGVV